MTTTDGTDVNELGNVVSLKRASSHRKKAAPLSQGLTIKNQTERGSGNRLLQSINRAMAERSHSLEAVAAELGISSVYLRSIITGGRSFANVDRKILQKAAAYLSIPVAQVYLMADAMEASDFFYQSTIENELHLAYNSMTTHSMWSGYAPGAEEWNAMTMQSKLFICMLYERATSQQFLTAISVDAPSQKS